MYNRVFKECCLYRVEAYEGIPELLAFLKENHILCTVLSNKPHVRTIENINYVFGPDVFDRVYGERESAGIKKKPSPEGVEALLEELGISKEECLYLGDTNTDMETGKNSQVDTVGVLWGFRSRDELKVYEPALLAEHPMDVAEFIKGVNHIE